MTDQLVSVGTQGPVATLTMHAPPVNAMSMAMYGAMTDALAEASALDGVRCLVLRSGLPARFCGGADVNELAALGRIPVNDPSWEIRRRAALGVITALENFPYPTVAAIGGYAVGMGFVLTSVCDMRICTPETWFSIPELDVARCGGARHALRVLPQAIVRSMYFSGERLGADRAHALGLVNEVVDQDSLDARAAAIAADVALRNPVALRLAKEALNRGQELAVRDGYLLELLYSARLAGETSDGD
jgi:enoyl-CoA hydratase